jgi:16S rRNA (guanine527-N7)-methyltransferase
LTERDELLVKGLREIGMEAEEGARSKVLRHLDLVSMWNEQVNLTAVTDPQEMIWKHAVDSATLFRAANPAHGGTLLDVGTGAGFPGVVAKALRPDLRVTLLETLQKRCRFLEAVGEEFFPGDPGYRVLWSRAEDAGQDPAHREQYDLVTARAVAELRILLEYCLPFVKLGGQFVAMKGPGADQEIASASAALSILGGEIIAVERFSLPGGAGERTLITVKKVKPTPKPYPRKAGTPAKKPL